MSGTFGIPWSTFSAFVVVGVSIILAILWAVRGGGDDEGAP